MAIKLLFRNAFTRQRNRNDFPVRMSFLASQALHRLNQLAFSLERQTDQENGLAVRSESPKALRDEVEQRFEALCNTLGELQAVADQHHLR